MSNPTYTRVLAEPEHRAATKSFLQLLERAARLEGWREYEAFNNWMVSASCALFGATLKACGNREKWETNEAEYMAVVAKCRKPQETMDILSRLLGTATMALHDHPQDFLGPIFMELSANSSGGQFFTSVAISRMMAEISLAGVDAKFEEVQTEGRSFLSLSEPACGVGGMVLASNAVLRERGVDPARNVHWTCVDVDWRCARAAYIQLTLTGTSAHVIHGDTLRLEEHSSMPTFEAVRNPKIMPSSSKAQDPDPLPDVAA